MIGPIGNTSYDANSVQQTRADAASKASKMFEAIDTNNDGKVTEDELNQAIQASGKTTGLSAAEFMKQLDQGNKGYLTKQDLQAGLEKAAAGSPATAAPQGPPPGHVRGGHGRGGDAPDAAEDTSTSTTTTFDPADLNQDGVVTPEEQLEYAQKLYASQQDTQGASPTSSQNAGQTPGQTAGPASIKA